jgi:hypothetical protein
MVYLTIPELPPAALSANARRRQTPWKTQRLTKDAKELWYWLMYGALQELEPALPIPREDWPFTQARLSYFITWPTRRMLDWDNCYTALKVVTDAIVSLGIIEDDSPKCLISAPRLEYTYTKGVSTTGIRVVHVLGDGSYH